MNLIGTYGTALADHLVIDAGTVLFAEGDAGSCAYIIEEGSLEIALDRPEGRLVLARRGAGEVVGEMAIIDRRPRSATATALETCTLLPVTREQLASRLTQTDPVLRMCLAVVLERLRSTLDQLRDARLGAASAVDEVTQDQARRERHDAAIGEMRLEQELKTALRYEEFELHYQPIVQLETGLVAGFEALIRWRHPTRGLVPPGCFLPTAEASGIIQALGRWTFREACAALVRLTEGAPPAALAPGRPFMSVNVSARDFSDPGFVAAIGGILRESGARSGDMKLEITESLLMQEPDSAAAALRACRALGLRIAVDDFGTGYSSLSYLHKFAIDTLKIDRSFVSTLGHSRTSQAVIEAVAGLASQLDMPVVAEGVEEPFQAAALRDFGCTYGQGYLYARPLREDEAARALQAWRPTISRHRRELEPA